MEHERRLAKPGAKKKLLLSSPEKSSLNDLNIAHRVSLRPVTVQGDTPDEATVTAAPNVTQRST